MSTGDAAARRKVANRLRRARGQLDAVIAAVESGAPCGDVVHQLSAVTHALNRAGFLIISTALEECLASPEQLKEREGLTKADLEKLFLTLA